MLMLNLIVKKEKRLKLVKVDWKVCFVVGTCSVYSPWYMVVIEVNKRFVVSTKIKERVK